ncbi:MAG TPA: M48 family metallopeptidase [Burkholderiales bacterium]
MTPFRARYYDGKTSQQREVRIWAEPSGRLRVIGDGIDFSWRLAEVRPSPRVGNTTRHLQFPDGSQCETGDNDAVDLAFARESREAPGRLIHAWESKYGYALLALALTAAVLWAGINYGIPALAKEVASALPPSVETAIGRDALAGLDRVLLEPSKLPPARQERMRALFASMISGIEGAGGYRLELRASKRLGANALALPSGEVVVTDQLVELAQNDDELVAVLAHEIGHLRQRHGLRRLLQDSATVLLIAAVTGDLTSVASLATSLPTILLQAKYSRDFEREADDFAIEYMKDHGVPAESFGAILLRMEQRRGASADVPDYLSTHPAARERAERSRAAH